MLSLSRITLPALVLAAFSSLVPVSCTKPELIGADLLANEAAQVGFADTLRIDASTRLQDAVLTYSRTAGRQVVRSLCGHLNDPFFGQSTAAVYTEVFLTVASARFLRRDIDSVILSLRYDTLGNYGDISQPVTFEVYKMTEPLDRTASLYSDLEPPVEDSPIAFKQTIPRTRDSLYIFSRRDTIRVPPMLRIPMGSFFVLEMQAQDSATFIQPDSFRAWMGGLHVRMRDAENTMVGFDLGSGFSALTVYYKDDADTDSTNSIISFEFLDQLGFGVHHTHITHDYTGSPVQAFLDDQDLADSLLLLQGMAGVITGIGVPGLQDLGNVLINHAQLELYIAQMDSGEDSLRYPPVPQIITTVDNDDGELIFSQDVQLYLRAFQRIDPIGGRPTGGSETEPKKYVIDVTATVQALRKGTLPGDRFYITPYLQPSIPHRVIFYGPGHAQYPARLRVVYTVID